MILQEISALTFVLRFHYSIFMKIIKTCDTVKIWELHVNETLVGYETWLRRKSNSFGVLYEWNTPTLIFVWLCHFRSYRQKLFSAYANVNSAVTTSLLGGIIVVPSPLYMLGFTRWKLGLFLGWTCDVFGVCVLLVHILPCIVDIILLLRWLLQRSLEHAFH